MLIGLYRIFKIYLCLVILMFLFRCSFVGYFGDMAHLELYKADLLKAFFIGWKYDSLVISYLLVPLYLINNIIVPFKSIALFNFVQFFQKLFFFLRSLVVLIVLFGDLGFYSFFQDHINILIFGIIEDDTIALAKSIWENYPVEYALLGFVLYLLFAIWLLRKLFPKVLKRKSYVNPGIGKYFFMVIFSFILLIGGLRGGYGDLVLAPKYSDFSESEFINQVAMNGIFALEKTVQLRMKNNKKEFDMTQAMGYGKNIHNAFGDFLGIDVGPTRKDQLISLIKRKTIENPKLDKVKLNVVVILMESFGGHWIQYNSEQFNFLGKLKEHFNEGHYFNNIISSDNGTIGSLMALSTNIPSRPGKRFLSESKFMQLPLESSAHIPFAKKGYETSFVYGGKLGWRDIGRYFKYQKYDNLVGENTIKKKLSLKGEQGTELSLIHISEPTRRS